MADSERSKDVFTALAVASLVFATLGIAVAAIQLIQYADESPLPSAYVEPKRELPPLVTPSSDSGARGPATTGAPEPEGTTEKPPEAAPRPEGGEEVGP